MSTSSSTAIVADSTGFRLSTGAAFGMVAIAILIGWKYSSLNLIHAQSGIGYWLGIAGTTTMALLLLYPARKRAKSFRNLGPVRYWFRMHMIMGVAGPLMIIFHSNFTLGSLNGRVALYCTLIVAGSGIIGRYLYAKLHYGLYGRSASIISLRADLNDFRNTESGVTKLIPTISSELTVREDEQLANLDGFFAAFAHAIGAGLTTRLRFWRLRSQAKKLIHEAAAGSKTVAAHEKRLTRNTNEYLFRRLTFLRKFAQYRAFERLFSLWHVVHYPLFCLLVIAAIVHVLAVHMY
jgi:hypothetical protein